VRGTLASLGTRDGFEGYRLAAGETYYLFSYSYGVDPIYGTTKVTTMPLQNNSQADILEFAGIGAIWKAMGYKGKSTFYYTLLAKGDRQFLNSSILVALGLLEPQEEPKTWLPAPPIDPTLKRQISDLVKRNGV
jgi:hypothetical protein